MRFYAIPQHIRYRLGLGLLLIAVSFLIWSGIQSTTNGSDDPEDSTAIQQINQAFIEVPIGSLDPTQQRLLTLLKQEYSKSPKSFDNSVLKYTEGFKESWCADFITWSLMKADTPVINPDTEYWRIPGVQTLQQYYINNDAYTSADSGYTPQLGDVVFYIGSQTPDNSSNEHAAFVLGVTADAKIITIGGNEANGIMRVRTESLKTNVSKGLVGYGKLYN